MRGTDPIKSTWVYPKLIRKIALTVHTSIGILGVGSLKPGHLNLASGIYYKCL
jgi:hypothetical protein